MASSARDMAAGPATSAVTRPQSMTEEDTLLAPTETLLAPAKGKTFPKKALLVGSFLLTAGIASAIGFATINGPSVEKAAPDPIIQQSQEQRWAYVSLGGGFRSYISNTGLMAALLAVAMKKQSSEGIVESFSFEDAGILRKFNIIGSNSGGNWFLASLLHSPEGDQDFLQLLQDCAFEGLKRDQANVAGMFNERFSAKIQTLFQPRSGVAESIVGAVGRLLRFLPGTPDGREEMAEILYSAVNNKWSWRDMVGQMLHATAGLKDDLTFESQPRAWAQGRPLTWFVSTTVFLPSDEDGVVMKVQNLENQLGYTIAGDGLGQADQDYPLFMPAKFCFEMNGAKSTKCSAPFVETSTSRNLANAKVKTYAKLKPFDLLRPVQTFFSDTDATKVIDSFSRIDDNAGQIHVIGAVAASSAIAGSTLLNPKSVGILHSLRELGQSTELMLPFFAFGKETDFKPFGRATEVLERFPLKHHPDDVVYEEVADVYRNLQRIANSSVIALSDGGNSDGACIGHAVRLGAKDIVWVGHGGRLDPTEEISYLLQYFEPHNGNQYPGFEAKMFTKSHSMLFDPPVFTYPSAQMIYNMYLDEKIFPTIAPENAITTKQLHYIKVGTIGNVKVRDSRWLGVQAGTFNLHAMYIASDLRLADFEDFNDFGHLVQDMIETVLADVDKQGAGSQKLMELFDL